MSALKLFYNIISPACRSTLMLTKTLNVKIQLEEVNILSNIYVEHLKPINPQHTVPILKDDDFIIWESHAINSYLISKYSNDMELYPLNTKVRALIDQRLHFDTGVLYPTLNQAILPILFRNRMGLNKSDVQKIRKSYSFVNDFLDGKEWLCGNTLTLADYSCVATLSTLDLLYPVNSVRYPNLYKYLIYAEDTIPYYKEYNLDGLDKLTDEIEKRISMFNSKYITYE